MFALLHSYKELASVPRSRELAPLLLLTNASTLALASEAFPASEPPACLFFGPVCMAFVPDPPLRNINVVGNLAAKWAPV